MDQEFRTLNILEAIENTKHYGQIKREKFLAFYSSVFGGIVIDFEAMLIPIDDHMCHRGHAVFDTATISNGYIYNSGTPLN